jgi:xylose isomerase
MDWQHLIMNGESLGEYAAMLAAEGLLGHQHANSGWGTFDDDNMVGATAFMETLELALELRRAGYGENGERLGFDLYPYTEDAVAAVERSVLQWRFIDGIGAARGPVPQGRRPRLRARLRRPRCVTPPGVRASRRRASGLAGAT